MTDHATLGDPETAISPVERIAQLLPDLDTAIRRANIMDDDNAVVREMGNRAGSRLADWLPFDRWPEVGCSLKEDATAADIAAFVMKPWTAESVAEQIGNDVAFAFDKALGQRGISASLMHDVCMTWALILGLEIDPDDYDEYGLPGIKALAVALGLPNPIGDDRGDEERYAG